MSVPNHSVSFSSEEDGRLASVLFGNVAFPLLRRFQTVSPLVVYYHLVSDKAVAHIEGLYRWRTAGEFERDLDLLLKFYEPISLEQLLEARRCARQLPPRAMLLTFDDGLRETIDVIAPVLGKKGVPALFFLCSAFLDNQELSYDHKKALLARAANGASLRNGNSERIRNELRGLVPEGISLGDAILGVRYSQRQVLDRLADLLEVDFVAYLKNARPYLDSEQVRELLGLGHAIGSHSIDHPLYRDISLQEQVRQTLESTSYIRERFGLRYSVFSFPHSDAGVSNTFFERVLGPGKLDLTFGNRGLLLDCVAGNVQRTTMEKTWMPAKAILGKAYAHRLYKRVTGNGVVKRTAMGA